MPASSSRRVRFTASPLLLAVALGLLGREALLDEAAEGQDGANDRPDTPSAGTGPHGARAELRAA